MTIVEIEQLRAADNHSNWPVDIRKMSVIYDVRHSGGYMHDVFRGNA